MSTDRLVSLNAVLEIVETSRPNREVDPRLVDLYFDGIVEELSELRSVQQAVRTQRLVSLDSVLDVIGDCRKGLGGGADLTTHPESVIGPYLDGLTDEILELAAHEKSAIAYILSDPSTGEDWPTVYMADFVRMHYNGVNIYKTRDPVTIGTAARRWEVEFLNRWIKAFKETASDEVFIDMQARLVELSELLKVTEETK